MARRLEAEGRMKPWVWVACLVGAGGALGAGIAWLEARPRRRAKRGSGAARRVGRARLIVLAAVTSSAAAWLVGSPGGSGQLALSSAVAFVWSGFVTAAWIAAERDKRVLRLAVCRAISVPAAHPDTVRDLAHASADAVFDAVAALEPRRLPR